MSDSVEGAAIPKIDFPLPKTTNKMSEYLAENITKIRPIVNPKIDFQQFSASVIVAVNQLSAKCELGSVLVAAFNAAYIGLMPGKHLGMCFFIPRKGRCNLEIGYRGFLELAFENKFLKTAYCDVVYEGEKLKYKVTESGPKLIHEPKLDRDLSNSVARNKVRYAYCVYQTVSGGCGVNIVNRKQIDAVDSHSNVWKSDYVPMCLKTPIRRAAKLWKLSSLHAHAIALDEQSERGAFQDSIVAIGDMSKVGGEVDGEDELSFGFYEKSDDVVEGLVN